ncbi:uncharacterized protein [Procambarus clarkii]|uniref:uncharacterized protein n=1 Tax=Procambarus clarkii TaxID=6728 RepID=UPI001E6758C7|nr:glycine-rich protein 5-like [Procambarus clarkii]
MKVQVVMMLLALSVVASVAVAEPEAKPDFHLGLLSPGGVGGFGKQAGYGGQDDIGSLLGLKVLAALGGLKALGVAGALGGLGGLRGLGNGLGGGGGGGRGYYGTPYYNAGYGSSSNNFPLKKSYTT